MEEDFWYPQEALKEAERLAPVPTPGATKRQRPKFQPIRFELITDQLLGSLIQTSISPQRERIEEDFSYPRKALKEAERLAPVSFPGATKRQRPKFQPIRAELGLNDLQE